MLVFLQSKTIFQRSEVTHFATFNLGKGLWFPFVNLALLVLVD